MIGFTVPGDAVPQLRARHSRAGNYIRTYDPQKCTDYKAHVAWFAKKVAPKQPLACALEMSITVYKGIPQSWSNKKAVRARSGEIRPTGPRGDVDNLAKGIMDALKGVIWEDDGQVVRLVIEKWYSDNPRAEVKVKEIEKGVFSGE